jgi:hypothetical protein
MERMHIWSRHGGHDSWSAGSSDILLKGTPKDDSDQVWFKLAQWFQRRRFLKKFIDGLMTLPTNYHGHHVYK